LLLLFVNKERFLIKYVQGSSKKIQASSKSKIKRSLKLESMCIVAYF